MYENPTLFICPYCPDPEGEFHVDAEACEERRAEDPDAVYLRDNALDDPQSMIRFGRWTDRRTPCPHLVHAHGTLEWEVLGRDDEDEYDGDPDGDGEHAAWAVDFDWTAPVFRDIDQGVGGLLLGTPEHLRGITDGHRHRVQAVYHRVRKSWDPLPVGRKRGSEYRIDALFFVSSHPRRLRALIGERVRQIKEHARAQAGQR